ncbi:MAG: DUF5995 family protein [Bacteroidota bacterium]
MPLPTNIDEVIQQLEAIISAEVVAGSNLAYFPTLYKKVTERIKKGIENKEFEDNPRMERLDVIFASRFIEAYQQFKSGIRPIRSWEIAFEAAANRKFLIMQHLLLGINAHINLDLGIAVSETMGTSTPLDGIKNDFDKINEILASMVNGAEEDIGKVSPVFRLLEKLGKGKEDAIVTFSIDLARDGAWRFANRYHMSTNPQLAIKERDESVARLATGLTTTKSRLLRWVIRFIRFFETKNVAKVVAVLRT